MLDIKRTLSTVIVTVALTTALDPAAAQDSPDAVEITIYWRDTKPSNGMINPWIFLGFHNGQFDSYDFGKPLPSFTDVWLRQLFAPSEMRHAFEDTYPETRSATIFNPRQAAFPGPVPFRTHITLNPHQHRFLSYLMPLSPSNDAFIGNEDPFEIELFDINGRFRGPMYVDVYGNQVADGGLCANDEAHVFGLDYANQAILIDCSPGEGEVRPHPGLNGSYRNPDGLPQRVLGGTATHYPPTAPPGHVPHYDAEAADFSRPGYKIGRLMITRRWASGESSGSYYSPERAGEGFNIEIVEPAAGQARRRILVYWYTFTPDGSGEQVWLAGMGEMGADGGVAADVEMYLTTGGEFASTSNPELVDRQRWGTIRIGFGQCGHGRVFYHPDDPDWPAGDYFINRLSPSIEGLGWTCASPENSRLILPED